MRLLRRSHGRLRDTGRVLLALALGRLLVGRLWLDGDVRQHSDRPGLPVVLCRARRDAAPKLVRVAYMAPVQDNHFGSP